MTRAYFKLTAIFNGGLISLLVRKFGKNADAANAGNVISAGLLGGKGVTEYGSHCA